MFGPCMMPECENDADEIIERGIRICDPCHDKLKEERFFSNIESIRPASEEEIESLRERGLI